MDRASATTRTLASLLHHRRWTLAFYALLTLAAAPGLLRLRMDNSPEVFFVHDHRALARYRQLEMDFGRDRAVRLVLSGPGVWTTAGLRWMAELEQRTAKLPGVMGTAGLYRHHRSHLPAWPPPDPQTFRRQVLANPLDREVGWVSRDGEVVTILAVLYRLPPGRQRALLGRLEALLTPAPAGVEARIAGLPTVERAVDDALVNFTTRFFAPLLLLAAAFLATTLRSLRDLAPPLALVGVCLVVLFGTMGIAGQRINLVVILLAPLLLVIALATAVHVLLRFRDLREAGLPPPAAARETYREKGWAVFWTGATTWVGFGSLALSPAPQVRAFGVWAAFAIAFMTLAAFTLYPALLATAAPTRSLRRGRPFERLFRRWGRAGALWAVRRRGWLLAGTVVITLLGLAGVGQLPVETSALGYLAPGQPARVELEALQSHGIGAVSAELVLQRRAGGEADPGGPNFRQPRNLDRLAALTAQLRREPDVLGAVSAGDLLEDAVVTFHPGETLSAEERRAILDRLETQPESGQLLSTLVTPDGASARISLFVPMVGFDELAPLFDRAQARARQAFPHTDVWITGQYPLVLAAQRTILYTVVLSLTLTLAAVTLIFRLLLGSGRLTFLALVPNVLPVVFVLGVMGWLSLPLDSTTVMISSVVLGLAVDDTIHSLGTFRRLAGRLSPPRAAVTTLQQTAPAHVLSTLILAAGFGVCGLSSFVPIGRFGTLTAVALLVALAADLVLVPALLAGLGPAAIHRLRPAADKRAPRSGRATASPQGP